MRFSRRALIASSPAFVLAAVSSPLIATRPRAVAATETHPLRPITDTENSAILDYLRTHGSDDNYAAWFCCLRFMSLGDRTINVIVPNRITFDWVPCYYLEDIAAACRHILGDRFNCIAFVLGPIVHTRVHRALIMT